MYYDYGYYDCCPDNTAMRKVVPIVCVHIQSRNNGLCGCQGILFDSAFEALRAVFGGLLRSLFGFLKPSSFPYS